MDRISENVLEFTLNVQLELQRILPPADYSKGKVSVLVKKDGLTKVLFYGKIGERSAGEGGGSLTPEIL